MTPPGSDADVNKKQKQATVCSAAQFIHLLIFLKQKYNMSSDFEAYEQDFGTLTAEITSKVGRIPKLAGGKWLLN